MIKTLVALDSNADLNLLTLKVMGPMTLLTWERKNHFKETFEGTLSEAVAFIEGTFEVIDHWEGENE